MSTVHTSKQLAEAFSIIKGYEFAVLQGWRRYRIATADLGGSVYQRLIDAISNTDNAYVLEEFAMWQSWKDGYLGAVGAGRLGREYSDADRAWLRAWKLHRLPDSLIQEDPSPLVLVDQMIASGAFPALPQKPQFRKRIPMPDGTFRTIRTGKDR